MGFHPAAPDSHATDLRAFLPAFHNRLADLLRRIEDALAQIDLRHADYGESSLRRRLLQEVSFLLEPELRRADAARALSGRPPLQVDSPTFRCAGMIVDARTGSVRPTAGLWLASVARFSALWLGLLWLAACAIPGHRRAGPQTLVLGVPEENLLRGDDALFAEFARGKQIAPFHRARQLLVQSFTRGARSTDPARIVFARHPLLERIRSGPPGLRAFRRLARDHFREAARFLQGVVRMPLLAVLWRDLAFHAPVAYLNRESLIESVVITNSNWGRQPLWMIDLPGRRFESHMVFYSQHDRPPSYIDVAARSMAHPTTRLLCADHFWVWTKGQAALLSREGATGETHVVGPILWEADRRSKVARGKRWISVFDIMPLTAEANRSIGFLGNYYATGNLMAFLDGIERSAAIAGIDLPFVVKPKRAPSGWHDPQYLARLANSSTFRLLPASTPLLSVIAQSAAVIVYPYSSVAYVADWAGVPAIYFDPTGRLARTFEPAEHIRFAASVDELATSLAELANR